MTTNLQAVKISDGVYWVGAIDWKLRDFHGYNTSRGSTYNAYLILGDEPILIDTVKAPFMDEMLQRIASIINPKQIRHIVSNHAEMDHSGSLPALIDLIKPDKIIASKVGVTTLKEHFHFDNQIIGVANGETITLGNTTLQFIDTKMIHWPESMFTYCCNKKILFSQDGFGMHLATTKIFTDENDSSIIEYEAKKYFANILMPYSALINRLFATMQQINLDIKMIAPAHGPIWRDTNNITTIFNLWQKWANKPFYAKAVIVYDSMWGSTETMAKTIADAIAEQNIATKVIPITGSHRSDIMTELMDAGALLLGSPTLNQETLPTMADVMCYIRGLKPKNLLGQVFGSYGWGAEAQKILSENMQKMGIEMIGEPVKIKYVPTQDALASCQKLGTLIAQALKERITA